MAMGMDRTSSSSVAELGAGDVEGSKVAAHQEYAEVLSLARHRRKRRWNIRSWSTLDLLSVAAVVIALLLILGAIYMHLKQRPHLGRLHIARKEKGKELVDTEALPISLDVAAGVAAQSITTLRPLTVETSEDCLLCIAVVATDNQPVTCGGKPCGIYRISWLYWMDAQGTSDPVNPLTQGYEGCVPVARCAEGLVRSYVRRFGYDCDGDGLIGCRDHVMLHLNGPTGCRMGKPLPALAELRMNKCFAKKDLQ
ncbi:uncharacterized protein LOC117894946 isoform X2 [Drosophila subobscura]|uniref:uncharacterized protein LOC117894946 isoform X2 n=1 Tax=Drosophila subobscura TaxID=7241 RepID=UPI00155A8B71|nr:uncharacterized protein LOC117894946 isoform X2 [Drosophila subobscura]